MLLYPSLRPLILCLFGTLACTEASTHPLTYDGSATIGDNIMPEAVRAFSDHTGLRFKRVGVSGSGDGFAALLENRADLVGISRDLTAEERARKPYYQVIGYDALAIFVHASNPVSNLTREQLKDVFSGAVTSWKDLGGPDRPIIVVTEPKTSSHGTLRELKEMVLEGAPLGPTRELENHRICAEFVATEPSAITAISAAYAQRGIRALSIDGDTPTPMNVRSGAYPLSRSLLLVSRKIPEAETQAFFEFLLSGEGQRIVARRFTPVSE